MSDPKLRNFHEAKWDEPVIFEQSVPGSRSILFPDVSQKAMPVTGDVSDLIPDHLKRQKSPALPDTGTASLSPAVPGDHRPGY